MKDFWIRFTAAVLGLIFCFIPTWLYLLARFLLEPKGFWQELILASIAVWILGAIQFFLFLIFLYWLYVVCLKS